MQLAGIQHITISPNLLNGLASTKLSDWDGKLGDYFAQGPANKSWETRDYNALTKNENAWRMAFTRSGFGTSEGKIIQAPLQAAWIAFIAQYKILSSQHLFAIYH